MRDDIIDRLRALPPDDLSVPADRYERVRARARRRRAGQVLAVLAAMVLLTGGGTAGYVAATAGGGRQTLRFAGSPTPTAGGAKPTPTAVATPTDNATGSPPPTFVVSSVSVVSATDWWSWGYMPNGSAQSSAGILRFSRDGGRHWTTEPSSHIRFATGSTSNGAGSVLFTDATHGYLYGPGLYVTADGGRHWQAMAVPASLSRLAVSGGRLYALGAACADLAAPSCQASVLYAGNLDGSSLHRVPGLPAGNQSELAASPLAVHLLVLAGSGVGPATLWTRTGSAWTSTSTPCAGGGADFGAVADYPPNGLALVCGGQPGAGSQPGKTAYRSADGGAHWARTGAVPQAGGYVGTLAALSASTWVLGENRGGVLVSHDGGAHWTMVAGTAGDGFWTLSQPQSGVVAAVTANAAGAQVALSTDGGGHWTVTSIP